MSQDDSIDFEKGDEFVPVVSARDDDEAEEYRQLLEDHEIEATVGYDGLDDRDEIDVEDRSMSRGIPVLVPESLLDEASEIIADREDDEEFAVDEETEDEGDEADEFTLELKEDIEPEDVAYLEDDEDDEFEDDDFIDGDNDEFDDDEDDEFDL
ncbi:MAG: hypothetical protein GVY16_07005 [Planctomycetes bacterium]|jgi:hypothetical protein|nr:hypothetical protein [Planctomycetota bacterium]